jgi:hypothetical protein
MHCKEAPGGVRRRQAQSADRGSGPRLASPPLGAAFRGGGKNRPHEAAVRTNWGAVASSTRPGRVRAGLGRGARMHRVLQHAAGWGAPSRRAAAAVGRRAVRAPRATPGRARARLRLWSTRWHGAIRAHQNREPDEHQRQFENCNAGWRRVSACSPGQRTPPGLARRVPGLSGCTGPHRARQPLLQSPSTPNCAAPAQNWGRMAHADGLVRAQMAHGASLALAGVRAAADSARGPGDCLRHTPSARRGPNRLSCATGGPRQVLLQSLGGAACASGMGAGAAWPGASSASGRDAGHDLGIGLAGAQSAAAIRPSRRVRGSADGDLWPRLASAVCAPTSDESNARTRGHPGLAIWSYAPFRSCAAFPSWGFVCRHCPLRSLESGAASWPGLGLGKLLAADQPWVRYAHLPARLISPSLPAIAGRRQPTHPSIPSPNLHPHRPAGLQSKRDGHDSKPEGAAFGAERGEAKRAPAVRQPERPSRSRRAPTARDSTTPSQQSPAAEPSRAL